MSSQKKTGKAFDWIFYLILITAYILSFGGIIWYVHYTWDYMTMTVMERPFHDKHAFIKPGGIWGHGFGIIGSLMLIIMHVYSIRKRIKFFRGWGNLKKWLHFHIFMGIIGSVLIMVHSTGKAHGLVALSFWSMVLVFLSGFVGRFFYGAIPRRATGLAYSLEEAADISESLSTSLKRKFARIGNAAEGIELLESRSDVKNFLGKYVKPFGQVNSLRRFNEPALYNMRPIWGFSRQMIRDIETNKSDETTWKYFLQTRKRQLEKRKAYMKRTIKTLEKAASLKRKTKRWKSIQARLYYWHVFHKPLSVVMYIILSVHIYIAVKYGFVWIF